MNTLDANQSELPRIEPRIFWINIQYKLFIPIIVGVLMTIGSFKLTTELIPNKWESSAYLIRHAKNMSRQDDIPYLYLKTDLNTVLETILLRENLQTVIDKMTLNVTPEELRAAIKINKGSKSKVVEVNVTWQTKPGAMQIADLVCQTFLENYASVQNAAAKKIYQYYQSKLATTQDQIYQSNLKERLFRQHNNVLDFDAQKINLYKSVSGLELRLMDEEVKLSDLRARYSRVQEQLIETDEKSIISEVLRTNEGNRTKALKSQLEVLRKRYTESNPKIQHLVHQISVLEQGQEAEGSVKKFDEVEYGLNPIHEELVLRKLQLDTDIMATQVNLSKYQNNIDRISNKIADLSALEQKHHRLKQDVDNNEDLASTINTRLIETSLAMESNISDFDILEYAQPPQFPKKSYRKIISIALAALGAFAITAFILLREFINNTAKTEFDLRHITGSKFSAVLPNKDEVSEQTFYSQFQLLFSASDLALRDRGNRFLSVSSMSNGDGKSFICNELVENYLKLNKRVLYIESEETLENVPSQAIINRLLNEGGHCQELQVQQMAEKLDKCYFQIDKQIYLDILEEDKLKAFLNSCYDHYDIVIWELFSPNIHLQLFKTISKHADFNLLLAKSRHTPKEFISNTLKVLNNWEIYHVGLLLNLLPKQYIRTTL